MSEKITLFANTKISKIIFLVSIGAAVIWIFGRTTNVYQFAVVGAIFEILWLPLLGVGFILPVISFVLWVKDKFNFKSLHLYSFLILLFTIVFTIMYK
jgi:hypothetical protein